MKRNKRAEIKIDYDDPRIKNVLAFLEDSFHCEDIIDLLVIDGQISFDDKEKQFFVALWSNADGIYCGFFRSKEEIEKLLYYKANDDEADSFNLTILDVDKDVQVKPVFEVRIVKFDEQP